MVADLASVCWMEWRLSATERVCLCAAMKQAASTRLYRRLQAVLLAGDGHSATQIAAVTGMGPRRVQNWCVAWRRSPRRRLPQQVLAEQPRLGRRPGLAGLDRARLLCELAQDPWSLGDAATNWTVPLLATHLQRPGWPIRPRTLRRRLHAQGCAGSDHALSSPNRSHTSPGKRALVRSVKGLPAGGRLRVPDETTLCATCRPGAPPGLCGVNERKYASSGKNARRSLFSAIDLRNGRRVLMVSRHQRIGDFQRFLRRLRHGVGACGALWL